MAKEKGPRVLRIQVYKENGHFPMGDIPTYRQFTWIGIAGYGLLEGFSKDVEKGEDYLARQLGELSQRLKEANPNLRQIQVTCTDRAKAETFYVDGYWGRPAIPSETVGLRPLSRTQAKNLRDIIQKLKMAGEIPRLLVA